MGPDGTQDVLWEASGLSSRRVGMLAFWKEKCTISACSEVFRRICKIQLLKVTYLRIPILCIWIPRVSNQTPEGSILTCSGWILVSFKFSHEIRAWSWSFSFFAHAIQEMRASLNPTKEVLWLLVGYSLSFCRPLILLSKSHPNSLYLPFPPYISNIWDTEHTSVTSFFSIPVQYNKSPFIKIVTIYLLLCCMSCLCFIYSQWCIWLPE